MCSNWLNFKNTYPLRRICGSGSSLQHYPKAQFWKRNFMKTFPQSGRNSGYFPQSGVAEAELREEIHHLGLHCLSNTWFTISSLRLSQVFRMSA